MSYTCSTCQKTYLTKHNFNKHDAFCKWMVASSQKQADPVDKLTETQKNKLLMDLLHEVRILRSNQEKHQREIQSLKKRERMSMTKWLSKTKIPSCSLYTWFQRIPVNQNHLEKVFDNDLLAGVCECIKEELTSYQYQQRQAPLYAFTQKTKTVYVYVATDDNAPRRLDAKDESKWVILTTDILKRMFNIISKKLEDQFGIWQSQHAHLVEQSEDWTEKEMTYTRKVMGMHDNEQTRMTRLKQWIYTQIHLPYQEVEIAMDA